MAFLNVPLRATYFLTKGMNAFSTLMLRAVQASTVPYVTQGWLDFRFHDLRHTAASHMIMAGVDIVTVREILGHKTMTMTLRYARLTPSHKKKAVEALKNGYILVTVDKKEGVTDAVTP